MDAERPAVTPRTTVPHETAGARFRARLQRLRQWALQVYEDVPYLRRIVDELELLVDGRQEALQRIRVTPLARQKKVEGVHRRPIPVSEFADELRRRGSAQTSLAPSVRLKRSSKV